MGPPAPTTVTSTEMGDMLSPESTPASLDPTTFSDQSSHTTSPPRTVSDDSKEDERMRNGMFLPGNFFDTGLDTLVPQGLMDDDNMQVFKKKGKVEEREESKPKVDVTEGGEKWERELFMFDSLNKTGGSIWST